MNKNSRILPHLNVCYLQKKAYDAHKKKIDYIRQSLRGSLLKRQNHSKDLSRQKQLNRSATNNRMSTIKEEVSANPIKMSPRMRRKLEGYEQENHRLIKRIETCSSTIKRKDMQMHMMRNQQIKNRISKFKNSADSKKTKLKSVLSLQRLERAKQKQHIDLTSHSHKIARTNQKSRYTRSLISQFSNDSSSVASQTKDPKRQKDSFNNFMLKRNTQKIGSHFKKDDFVTRAKAKLEAMKTGKSTEMKRKDRPEGNNQFWRSRCFTTQLQSY